MPKLPIRKVPLRKSIGLRLIKSIFGCYLVVTTLLTGTQLYSEYRHVETAVLAELMNLESSLDTGLSQSLWDFNQKQLNSILAGVTKLDKVIGIKVVDTNNRLQGQAGIVIMADSNTSQIKTLLDGKIKRIRINTEPPKEVFEYRFPVLYYENKNSPGNHLGYGHLYSDDSVVTELVQYSFILILLAAIVKTIFLWIIFLYFSNKYVSQPLKTLTEATLDLNPDSFVGKNSPLHTIYANSNKSQRRLESLIKVNQDNELHVLTQCFLSMSDAIKGKISELEKSIERSVVDTAYQAGMSEIATDILHNIGNRLNSIATSSGELLRISQKSKFESLEKVNELLSLHAEDLAIFLTSDVKGKKVPEYLRKLASNLKNEHVNTFSQVENINRLVASVSAIVASQQRYAHKPAVLTEVNLSSIIEDALESLDAPLNESKININKDFKIENEIVTQKTKLLNIFINLITTAIDAVKNNATNNRHITIETFETDNPCIRIHDNGSGLSKSDLEKVFGQTECSDSGHGRLELHSSAIAMSEINGSIAVESPGINQGTTFILTLPKHIPEKSKQPML